MAFIIWGGFLFWTILGIECLIITLAMIFDKAKFATISLITTIALFQVCSNVDLWSKVKTNWLSFLSYVVIYILIGLIWSVFKFKLKTLKYKKNLSKKKENNEEIANWEIPSFDTLTSRIVGWTSYWPFSIIAFLLEDFLKEIITFVWETCLVGLFKRIYEKDLDEFRKYAIERDKQKETRQKEYEERSKKQQSE